MPVYQFKLVLLGESAVGKSSIVVRFVRNSFNEHQESTIGGTAHWQDNVAAAFLTQTITLENDTLKFEIWDTAGQERYHSLAPMYYRGAHAAIVVYDITSRESFERAKTWIKELQRQASSDIVIALVGNKIDLEAERRVQDEEVNQYVDQLNLVHFKVSAKSGENIPAVFERIARKLPRQEHNLASARSASGMRRLELAASGQGRPQSEQGRCCQLN